MKTQETNCYTTNSNNSKKVPTQDTHATQQAGTGFMKDMSEILRILQGKGYTENIVPRYDHFEVKEGTFKLFPKDFEVDEIVRYENASDPDDQSILYAITSEKNHLKGVYIESYGIYQDELSQPMIERLKNHLH